MEEFRNKVITFWNNEQKQERFQNLNIKVKVTQGNLYLWSRVEFANHSVFSENNNLDDLFVDTCDGIRGTLEFYL